MKLTSSHGAFKVSILYDLECNPNDCNDSLLGGRSKPGIFLCLLATLQSIAGVDMAEDNTPTVVEGPLATFWSAFWMKIGLRL